MSLVSLYAIKCDKCRDAQTVYASSKAKAEELARLGSRCENMAGDLTGYADRFTKKRTGEWWCPRCAGKPRFIKPKGCVESDSLGSLAGGGK